jgi:hypothetical protein
LGPEQVGAGTRTAGAGFADLARQATANAPALASMQGPDRRRQLPRYGFLEGSLPGTVPKTGNYQLHRGEVVVSEPQVDEPLIAALVEDKMRKGITGKNPKGHRGNSYDQGSLAGPGPYVRPEWTPYPDIGGGFTLPNRPETRLRLGSGRLSGFEDLPLGPEFEPPGPGVRPEWSPDIEVQRKIRGLIGPGEGGMTRTGPGVGPYGPAGGASASSARANRKLLGPGSSTDEIIEGLAKATGNPKASYKGLGKPALIAGGIALGIYAVSKALGGRGAAADIPGAPQATPPAPGQPDFWSDPSAHSFGAMLRGLPEAAYGSAQENLGKLGEVWGGITGAPPPPRAAAAPPPPAEQDVGSQSTSPSRGGLMARGPEYAEPEIPENLDLAVALSRARGGGLERPKTLEEALARRGGRDLGTPEDPLTLSGSSGLGPMTDFKAPEGGRGDEYLPEAERGYAPESAEWRRAESQRTMATMNRQKADRIRDYLLSEGENMDSDTRKDLMHGADWLDSAAEAVEKRHQERQEKREELVSKSQDAIVKADAEIRKAQAKGEEVRATIAQKSLDELEDYYQDMQKSYVDIKGEADARGRERMLRAMAQTRVAQSRFYGEEVSLEEAMLNILQELEPELYQEAVEAGE